jgi:ABC-type nitrate/sulfonate/bicarbonate transport system permease component
VVTARAGRIQDARSAYSTIFALASRAIMIFALPSTLIAIWWFASAGSTSFFFPPLSEVMGAFGPTWFEGGIAQHLIPSLARLTGGYTIALIIGIASGVALGLSPNLRAFSEPVLDFFRAIPPPVMVPILMLFLGIGDTMKVWVIALGALWPIMLNTIAGVRGVDEVLLDTARVYGIRRMTHLRTLILRGASPQIVAGARQALSIAIILMVISEMFAANNGLGFTIVQFQRSFAMPEMWSGIILIGLVGVGLAFLFQLVERSLLFWHRGLRHSQKGGV